ncbi:MAG: radical SAM protein [Deltaproteobacteria bacterium]|nr:radical SAM protein [Deltaproteobacteria bacterium]
MIHAELSGHYRDDGRYPAVVANITNRCNLACQHCFIFRDGNPNEAPVSVHDELKSSVILETLTQLRERHGIGTILWMGGEPLLRRELIAEGIGLFSNNIVVTNGTIPLVDLGPSVLYVVSLDGPEDLNDALRGAGTYRKVMRSLSRLPADMKSRVQVQCVVTKRNQHRLQEVVDAVRATRAGWMTFSFYVPRANDSGPDAWETNEDRAAAVREVMRLKEIYPGFIRNSARMLELMLPPVCKQVTDACPARDNVLPLYLEGDHFTTPFCCYGNDVDCDRCGAWVVFQLAARLGLAA